MACATSSAVLGLVADFSKLVETLYNLYNRHKKYRSYLKRLIDAVELAVPSIRKLDNPHCRVPADFVDLLKQDINRGMELLTDLGAASWIKFHLKRMTTLNGQIEEVYDSLLFHIKFMIPVLVSNGETICGACGDSIAAEGFWICCYICEKRFHGKCLDVTPARAERIKPYRFPLCSNKKAA